MKIVRLFFVMMIAVVLLPGTSLARQADHSSQQAPSQSGDKSASDYQRDVEVRDENGQIRPREADQILKTLSILDENHNQTSFEHNPLPAGCQSSAASQ